MNEGLTNIDQIICFTDRETSSIIFATAPWPVDHNNSTCDTVASIRLMPPLELELSQYSECITLYTGTVSSPYRRINHNYCQ